jgi:Flp pilus assembly protein TadD
VITPTEEAKPAAAAAKPAEPPVVAAPAPAAAAPVQAEPEVPVDARAQAAFDTARRAMRAGRNDEAERQLKALAASNPELGGVHANLGLLYRQAGKLPEAVAAMEKAVQASPKQAVFHNQLGITYRQKGEFAKARDAYEKAIALDAAYPSPVLNLGILNDLYLQDRKRALALYDQYLALAGGDAAVTKWVADLKNRKDDHVALSVKEKP